VTTFSPVSVACCAALLLTAPLIARAASKSLELKDAEPQYESKLCWAAGDVLAVNQFYPHCPASTSTSTTPSLFPTSQAQDAGYLAWFWSTQPMAPPASTLPGYLSYCEGTATSHNIDGLTCNTWGTPPLNGLTFKWGKDFCDANGCPDPDGLDWATMTQEIDAGHPVLFVWNYQSDNTSTPIGNHELVVIGYSDDGGTQQLQIWDPWPVPDLLPPQAFPACGPANGVQFSENHSQTIPFGTYRTPVNDMGVPVTAVHAQDQWGLTLKASSVPNPPTNITVDGNPPPSPPVPPPFPAPPKPARALPQLSFAKALSMALPESRRLDLQRSGAGPRSLGVPFPIVGLGFVQLLQAADDPTRVLSGATSAVLFPVESQGEVVDAFLMLFTRGRWQRGGYANIEITRRLVDVRASYAARHHLPLHSFYMVSVPGEVAFFAAYGRGQKAILIPASTDPSIDAFAGVAVPAERQLTSLIIAIQRDLQRYESPGRGSVRGRRP
jgi:hypothetical protein